MGGRIVVGVDGSPEAAAALAWALDMAEPRHATVDTVHAFWCPSDSELLISGLTEQQHKASDVLRSAVEPAAAAHPGLCIQQQVIEGSPAPVLIDACVGADLLVVGSRGRGGFAGLLLGSVSQQCVHYAPCPIAVVRPAPSRTSAGGAPYTVVVGVDGSPGSRSALRWAVAEAGAHHGRVRAIWAWTPHASRELEGLGAVDDEKLQAALQERLGAAVAGVDTGDFPFDTELVEGDPRRILVDAAHDADLLVVGSHGRGGISGMLLGSVSSFCLHHATVPVVVLRDRT
jgi:nucleotide-binding universal stress UspA family protein